MNNSIISGISGSRNTGAIQSLNPAQANSNKVRTSSMNGSLDGYKNGQSSTNNSVIGSG